MRLCDICRDSGCCARWHHEMVPPCSQSPQTCLYMYTKSSKLALIQIKWPNKISVWPNWLQLTFFFFFCNVITVHQESIGSYKLPETSGHDSDNSADPSPPRTRPITIPDIQDNLWWYLAVSNVCAHVHSWIQVRWKQNQEEPHAQNVRISFYQDTQGLDIRKKICVLSRINLCNPSLTHCQREIFTTSHRRLIPR